MAHGYWYRHRKRPAPLDEPAFFVYRVRGEVTGINGECANTSSPGHLHHKG